MRDEATEPGRPPGSWDRIAADDPVVVIGAGLLGCSAAYHLLAAGACNVTLVDRFSPGDGTSSAGAGFVAQWGAGWPAPEPCVAMERYALEFYRGLHAAGHDIAYRANGNMIIAQTGEAWELHVAAMAASPYAEPGARIIGPAEIAAATGGVIDAGAVHAGLLMPSAIQIEAGKAVQAMAERIAAMGGVLRPGSPVVGLRTTRGEVSAVVTPAGALDAAAVVIAAGAWTNPVLRLLGARLPLMRVVATRLITGPLAVPPAMPTVQCYDYGMWIRASATGLTWGSASAYRPAYALEAAEGPITEGRPRSHSLLDLQLAEQDRTARIVPRLAGVRPESWFQGMPVYTPDGSLLAGRLPGFANVVVLAGDNESGVAHGPGLGRIAAELTRGDQPFTDPQPFRLDRFPSGDFPDEEAVGRALAARGVDRISQRPPA